MILKMIFNNYFVCLSCSKSSKRIFHQIRLGWRNKGYKGNKGYNGYKGYIGYKGYQGYKISFRRTCL